MSGTAQQPAALPLRQLARGETVALLVVAAAAWAATLAVARGMTGMSGTMGLSFLLFVAVWTLMMAAMMLPSVAPTASLYVRSMGARRPMRLGGLVTGYLAVWAVAGLPGLWPRAAGGLAGRQPSGRGALGRGRDLR